MGKKEGQTPASNVTMQGNISAGDIFRAGAILNPLVQIDQSRQVDKPTHAITQIVGFYCGQEGCLHPRISLPRYYDAVLQPESWFSWRIHPHGFVLE